MKKIKLTKDKYTFVDDDDFEFLNNFKWCVSGSKKDGYFATRTLNKKYNFKSIYMHRAILGAISKKIYVDHINHNRLDNRKINLRLATPAQSAKNVRIHIGNKSGYKGIWYIKSSKRWRARICVNGRSIHLGCFKKILNAVKSYNKAAKEYHGEFALLNKIN